MQFQNNEPIYLQIIQDMKQKIINGKYLPNEQLPPVREFAMMYEVNPNTMQKALSILEIEGLLYTKRTTGRYICDDENRIKQLKAELLTQQIRSSIVGLRAYGLSDDEIISLMRKEMENGQNED